MLALADANLARYPGVHLRLDVAGARQWIAQWRERLASSSFATNPLECIAAPTLNLLPDGRVLVAGGYGVAVVDPAELVTIAGIVVGAAGMYEARCRRCFEPNLAKQELERVAVKV